MPVPMPCTAVDKAGTTLDTDVEMFLETWTVTRGEDVGGGVVDRQRLMVQCARPAVCWVCSHLNP